jgi:hypothetical protein
VISLTDEEKGVRAKAYAAVATAIASGRLTKHPARCDVCGVAGKIGPGRVCGGRWSIEYHHHDHREALDVVAVCSSCHHRIHSGAIPEPRTGVRRAKPARVRRSALNPREIAARLAAGKDGERWDEPRWRWVAAELVSVDHEIRVEQRARAELLAELAAAGPVERVA